MMNLKYELRPIQGDDVIGYELTGPGIDGFQQSLGTRIAHLSDQLIRSQLVRAGWSSPEMVKVADSLNKVLVQQRDEAWRAAARKDALLRQCLEALETDDWQKKLQAAIDTRKEWQ